MAVAFDAVGPSSTGQGVTNATALSWSHTASGVNRYVLAAVCVGANPDTMTITATYAGSAMTALGLIHANNSTAGYVRLFALLNPPTTASTVAVSATATCLSLLGGSISLTGVNQTTPVGTPVTAFGNSATASATVTGTASGNMVVDALVTGTSTSASTQTQRWKNNFANTTAGGVGAQSTAAAGGSVAMSYTVGADFWGVIAVEVNAALSGPPTFISQYSSFH